MGGQAEISAGGNVGGSSKKKEEEKQDGTCIPGGTLKVRKGSCIG